MYGKQATSVLYVSCQMKMRVENFGVVAEKVSRGVRYVCSGTVEDVCGSDPGVM